MGRDNVLRRRVGSDDLRSEVKYALLQSVTSFSGTTEGEFWAFVGKIVYHVYVDAWRSESATKRDIGRSAPLDERGTPYHAPTAERRAIAKEDVVRLQESVDKLPKGERDAVRLAMEGLSNEEIAAKLGISNEAARQRLSRARRTLSNLRGTPPSREG